MTKIHAAFLLPDGRVQHVAEFDAADDLPAGFVVLGDWQGIPPHPGHDGVHLRLRDGALRWEDTRDLEERRAARWASLKAYRQELDEQPIAVGDFAIDGDAQSRQDIMGAVMAMQLTGQTERPWRCADNVMRPLTFADLVAAGTAIAARRQHLIEVSDQLWQQLQAAATVAEVDAVTWPNI